MKVQIRVNVTDEDFEKFVRLLGGEIIADRVDAVVVERGTAKPVVEHLLEPMMRGRNCFGDETVRPAPWMEKHFGTIVGEPDPSARVEIRPVLHACFNCNLHFMAIPSILAVACPKCTGGETVVVGQS